MYALVALCATILGGVNLCVASPDPSPDVVSLTGSTARFSHRLYRELTSDVSVAVYSPFGAHTTLSMAYLGARTTTADEMKSVLQLSSLPQPHEAYRSLLQSLNYVQGVVVYTANGIWVNENIKIRDQYRNDVISYYNATAEQINFSAPGGPHVPINQWVADKTDNFITDLLSASSINQRTVAILVNAIYFNGTWKSQFNPNNTFRAQFQSKERIVKEVDFMSQVGRFGVKLSAVDNIDVVRLPFLNENYAFYIVLPRTIADFPSLERLVNGDNFDGSVFFTGLNQRYVNITVPKFNVTATWNLQNPLKNMGLTTAFSDSADLTGISENVKISEVLQKAVIEIAEPGTVASAAGYVKIDVKNEPEDPFKIVADRPFVFYIRDDDSGLILFQGKQTDPTLSEVKN